jgi:hypothetical protein
VKTACGHVTCYTTDNTSVEVVSVRPRSGNKKLNFKITFEVLRASNNTRSVPIIAFDDPDHRLLFGEVLFFFIAHLPGDLSTTFRVGSLSSNTSFTRQA